MNYIPQLKTLIERMPFAFGNAMARVPYSYRPQIGGVYKERMSELKAFKEFSLEDKSSYIFCRTKHIVEHAFNNVQFYREYYLQHGFEPSKLKSFDDIVKIPVVNKELLSNSPLETRSFKINDRYLANTGGSSGIPLNFYIQSSSIGHEWAHMHAIWSKYGYKPYKLKLGFGGRNMAQKACCYDALRHQFAINIYYPHEQIASHLKPILRSYDIRYLHGYPSALYDFACYCEQNDPELVDLLAHKLEGAFLSSEFPSHVYRNKIESVFHIPSVSWYGHTERAILAWEEEAPFVYTPFQTYGFAETLLDNDAQTTKLVATSYYNIASPLIRYDTGDEVSVISSTAGILQAFRVEGGREGDYVIDSTGKKISLTGLVFGRHHRIFNKAKFFQVYQSEPGKVKIIITILNNKISEYELPSYFDLSGINIDFTFEQRDAPILTPGGKVILNISKILRKPF
jgi:phenylacetate-CoA ligase